MSLVLSFKRAGSAPRPSKNAAPRAGHAATGGHPTRPRQKRITSTGLLLALLAFGLSGCGGGSTDPGQRVVLGGVILVLDARGGPTLVEIEGLVNGRSVGVTRIPQGVQAERSMMVFLDDITIRSGVNRVGVRIRQRLPGSEPYFISVRIIAIEGPVNPTQVAQGDFRADRVVAAGEVVEFEFRVP